MQTPWERLFATNRSVARRLLVSAIAALAGFGIDYDLFRSTGFYFPFVIIVTVILISLYAGGRLAVLFAVMLSLAADYFFIPPVGAVLNSRVGWEHFAIIVVTSVAVAFGASSVRGAFRETTRARKDAERARRAAEEASTTMEQMLALVAHDVRNPLATTKMAVLVLLEPVDDKQREARAMMLRNLEQADAMIQSLLDVASVRAGRAIPLEFHACDLREEIGRVVGSLGGRARIELDADASIRGDWAAGGIARALQNLVANALKYGQPGSKIVVRLRSDGERALLSVHNDGAPIPAEDQEEIFRPFRRTKQGIESGKRGWGLGLSIVQAVAEAHGGNVTLESDATRGTTFTLALPIRATAMAAAPAAPLRPRPA